MSVAEVRYIEGRDAAAGRVPDLLVEVPHGATRRADFDRVRAELRGPLPEGLEDFFHVNTDEGAAELGLAIAEAVVEARPCWRAVLVRCLIPRTFIDTNREADLPGGDLRRGGLTPGLQPYITDPADRAHLRRLHADYQALCDRHWAAVCGAGGLALIPHTYAPRSVGIARVDEQIVSELHRVYSPGLVETWPLRPAVDVISRTEDGMRLSADVVDELIRALHDRGVDAVDGDTYFLHPSTMGAVRAAAWPGQTLCWEVRRDLLTHEWPPFAESVIAPDLVEGFAPGFSQVAVDWLDRRSAPSAG